MVSKKSRSEVRRKKHMKLRNRFSGTAQRPRFQMPAFGLRGDEGH